MVNQQNLRRPESPDTSLRTCCWMQSEIDSAMQEKKKDTFISSWFYNLATTTMIKQILWGFEGDLYEPCEYHYVCYYLEYILHINQKNNNYFLNKLDKAFLESTKCYIQTSTARPSARNSRNNCMKVRKGHFLMPFS